MNKKAPLVKITDVITREVSLSSDQWSLLCLALERAIPMIPKPLWSSMEKISESIEKSFENKDGSETVIKFKTELIDKWNESNPDEKINRHDLEKSAIDCVEVLGEALSETMSEKRMDAIDHWKNNACEDISYYWNSSIFDESEIDFSEVFDPYDLIQAAVNTFNSEEGDSIVFKPEASSTQGKLPL